MLRRLQTPAPPTHDLCAHHGTLLTSGGATFVLPTLLSNQLVSQPAAPSVAAKWHQALDDKSDGEDGRTPSDGGGVSGVVGGLLEDVGVPQTCWQRNGTQWDGCRVGEERSCDDARMLACGGLDSSLLKVANAYHLAGPGFSMCQAVHSTHARRAAVQRHLHVTAIDGPLVIAVGGGPLAAPTPPLVEAGGVRSFTVPAPPAPPLDAFRSDGGVEIRSKPLVGISMVRIDGPRAQELLREWLDFHRLQVGLSTDICPSEKLTK